MSRRFAGIVCVVALAATCAFGQNARMNALSGFYLLDDISTILVNPADMNDYTDQLELTWNGAVDPAIGIKSVGDVLALGLTYNPPAMAAGLDATPHLLLGLGLEPMALGLELYWERDLGNTDGHDVTPLPSDVTTETSNNTELVGAQLGINLPDVLDMAIVLGFRKPFASTYTLTTTANVNETETEVKAIGTWGAGGYVEATVDVGLDWTTGVMGDVFLYGKNETTTETRDLGGGGAVPSTTTEGGTDDMDLMLGLYTGVVKDFESNNILLGAMVTGSWMMTSTQPLDMTVANYNPGKVWTNNLRLDFAGMVEKEWTSLKRLDAVQGRAGIDYWMQQDVDHEEGDTTGYLHEFRQKQFLTRQGTGVDLTLGAGMTKGILQLDVQVSAAQLLNALKLANGTSVANDLICVSLGLDFKKLGKSSGGSRSSYSAPAPAPAPAAAEEPMDSGMGDLEF